ncbi:MAG: hypothetical protein LBI01_05465, partial [Elusimicrobium sp.]|nr:hypothetical protein [Elusimicrobium sp.]
MQTQLFKKLYAVADIIGDSFNVFFKNIVNLLLFQLIYVGAVIAGMIPCLTYLALKIGPVLVLSADLPQEQAQQAALDAFKTIAADPYFWLLFAALFIILIIAAVWKMAAVSAYLESKLLGAPLNIWQSFKKSYYRITPFVFTILAVGLAVYVLPFIFTGAAVFAFVSENYALGAAGIFGAFITFIAAWFAFMSVLP